MTALFQLEFPGYTPVALHLPPMFPFNSLLMIQQNVGSPQQKHLNCVMMILVFIIITDEDETSLYRCTLACVCVSWTILCFRDLLSNFNRILMCVGSYALMCLIYYFTIFSTFTCKFTNSVQIGLWDNEKKNQKHLFLLNFYPISSYCLSASASVSFCFYNIFFFLSSFWCVYMILSYYMI